MTKRINIAIEQNLYDAVVELARKEKRTPANFLSLFVENNLNYMLSNMAGQHQLQLHPQPVEVQPS